MKIVTSFKHMEHTPSLDQKIEEKSQKLKKYLNGNFEVQWTCYVRDDGAHCADIKLLGPTFEYHANAHSDRLYKTLDQAISKIEKQVQKKKSKFKDHKPKHDHTLKGIQINDILEDEEFWEDRDIDTFEKAS
jgi:putative sigma-54 modulation protein